MQAKRYYYITTFVFSMAAVGMSVMMSYFLSDLFKADSIQLSNYTIIYLLSYFILAPLMGYVGSHVNGKYMLIAGCISISLTSLIPFFAHGENWIYWIYGYAIAFSFSISLFYPNMIGFIGQSISLRGISRQIGFFNLGWVIPAIIASALSGFLLDAISKSMFLIMGCFGLVAALISLKIHRPEKSIEQPQKEGIEISPEEKKLLPAGGLLFMLLAWFSLLMVHSSIMGIIFPLFPGHADRYLGFTGLETGFFFALMGTIQGVIFLIMSRVHFWHFRLSLFYLPPILMFLALGLLCMTEKYLFILGIFALFGIVGAVSYNLSIFYSLVVSTNKSRGGGIHEGMLSAGSVFTVFIAGRYEKLVGYRAGAYHVGMLMCLIFLLVIVMTSVIIMRNRKRRNLPAAGE